MRNSKFIVSAIVAASTILGLGAASAADLAARPYTKAPPPVVAPVYNWTGFYIGANAGWVGSDDKALLTGTDTGTGGIARPIGLPPGALIVLGDRNSFIGGIQGGYNWQFSNWLIGLEADYDWLDAKNSTTFGNTLPGFVPVTYTIGSALQGLGTVRGRAGVLVTPAFLLYATGGLAYGKHQLSVAAVCPTCGPPANLFNQTSNWSAGWTVGGGGEWKFAPNWSVKAEYLYVDLGTINSTVVYNYGINTSSLTGSIHDHEHVARVGLNYSFNWASPVVAKY